MPWLRTRASQPKCVVSPLNSQLSEKCEADMIEGLRLTIPGEDLRRLLAQRIADHRRCADRWKREQTRTEEDQTEERPLLPEHMCENEAERHEWRAKVLEFIRDRIESTEVYRVGEADLHFGELLPEKPGSLGAGGIRRAHERRIPPGSAREGRWRSHAQSIDDQLAAS
jgi:hypothetical protein